MGGEFPGDAFRFPERPRLGDEDDGPGWDCLDGPGVDGLTLDCLEFDWPRLRDDDLEDAGLECLEGVELPGGSPAALNVLWSLVCKFAFPRSWPCFTSPIFDSKQRIFSRNYINSLL